MDYRLLLDQFEQHNQAAGWPRQRALHACLREGILSGRLGKGARLLSTRDLARELGVARNTVLYAYEQLLAEGLLQSSRRGTVVATLGTPARAPARAGPSASKLSRRAHAWSSLPAPAVLSGAFALGVPALDAFPLPVWRRLLEAAWRETTAHDMDYVDPAGLPELRGAIADYLQAARGVSCSAEQVVVTNGTQASLDLCARLFADAGDTAWIENPGYQGAVAALRGAQLRTVGIAVDEEGIAPTTADWRNARPRLIYATPSHQYPSGGVLGMPRRLELLARARQCGALIIEDDYDSEFRHDGPPLAAMQGLEQDAPVVYLGTFSKTMFPAMRTGFMVVPAHLARAVRSALVRLPLHGRSAEQRALALFLRDGQFVRHLRRMRRLYGERRDALLESVRRHFGTAVATHGEGTGMHLALRFQDAGWRDDEASDAAVAGGIVAHALSRHAVGLRRTPWNGLLLGYSQVPAQDIDAAVRRLARMVRQGP